MRCAHCGDPNPGVLHLFAAGPPPALRVGSLVVAKKTTGVCGVGEVGVVYEEHRLYDRAGWGIIFESGRHDGFNACEVEWFPDGDRRGVRGVARVRVRERPGAWSRILSAAFSRRRSTWRVPGLLQGQSGFGDGTSAR